jgi:guanosine-3',5'-bis(diphosphate) 3'-pyrophosphohydrolase
MILKAIEFATKKHEGQSRRGTGEPYIVHPIMVSYILAQYKQSKNIDELICSALLHDTLEDTDTTFNEIVNEFTPLVASLVMELTSDETLISQIGKNEYLKIKLCGISNYGLILKFADRLGNISDNPSIKMVDDTIELINHVRKNRKLTASQALIAMDILSKCNDLKRAK